MMLPSGGGEPLLPDAIDGDTADRKLLKKLRSEEQTSLVRLPACRVTKTKSFRDIWLVGKGELKRL